MGITKDAKRIAVTAGISGLVNLGLSLAEKGVDVGSKYYTKKAEEKDSLIKIPEVLSPDYRVNLNDAIRWLEEDGLKAESVVVKPDIAYKDYADMEVVATNYKLNKKVKPGTRIILKYVTAEVIKASKELFEESEKLRIVTEEEKQAQKEKKAQKKVEQGIKNREKLDETVTTVKEGLNDVVANTQKGFSKVVSSLTKKETSKKKKTTEE